MCKFLKVNFGVSFKRLMDQDGYVVAQDFRQGFVRLPDLVLEHQLSLKLAFQHGECDFGVASLMIVLHELLLGDGLRPPIRRHSQLQPVFRDAELHLDGHDLDLLYDPGRNLHHNHNGNGRGIDTHRNLHPDGDTTCYARRPAGRGHCDHRTGDGYRDVVLDDQTEGLRW